MNTTIPKVFKKLVDKLEISDNRIEIVLHKQIYLSPSMLISILIYFSSQNPSHLIVLRRKDIIWYYYVDKNKYDELYFVCEFYVIDKTIPQLGTFVNNQEQKYKMFGAKNIRHEK